MTMVAFSHWILLLLCLVHLCRGKSQLWHVVDKIESEIFGSFHRSCDLIIAKPAWTFVNPDILDDRTFFTVDLESTDDMAMIMSNAIRDMSTCIILVALEASSSQERMVLEQIISKESESTMILLTTNDQVKSNRLFPCSTNDWNLARRSFHLDLTTEKVRAEAVIIDEDLYLIWTDLFQTELSVCCALRHAPTSMFFQLTPMNLLHHGSWILNTTFRDKCVSPIQGQVVNAAFTPLPPFTIP